MSNRELAAQYAKSNSPHAKVFAILALADAIESLAPQRTDALPEPAVSSIEPISTIEALQNAAQVFDWLADRVGHSIRRGDQQLAMAHAKQCRAAAQQLKVVTEAGEPE